MAELRAQGKLLSWQQLLDRDKYLPAARNSALVYLKAFGQLQRTPQAEVTDFLDAEFAARPSPMAMDLLASVEEADAQGLATILNAAPLGEGCYPVKAGGEPWDLQLTQCEEVRRAARLCGQLAVFQAAGGRPAQATRYLMGGLGLASSLGRKALWIEDLVRIASDAITVAGLERSLALCSFSPEDLQALKAALQAEAAGHSFSGATAAERGLVEWWRQAAADGGPGIWFIDFPPGYFLLPGWRQKDELCYLEMADEVDHIGTLPPREAVAEMQRYKTRVTDSFARAFPPLVIAPKLLMPYWRSLQAEAEEQMQLATASAAIAVEQYRLKNGRWPETLDQLVPQFLDAVPEDCFDSGKLHYVRTDQGVRVYSIGPDRQDNGGGTREEAFRPQGGDIYDVVFRLLDPGLRGAKTMTFRDEAVNSGLTMGELKAAGLDEEALKRLGLSEEDLMRLRGNQ